MNALVSWMGVQGVLSIDVARALNLAPSEVWRYCQPDYWPSREVAARIYRLTGGAVTPNDLLGVADKSRAARLDEVRQTEEYRAGLTAIARARERRKEQENGKKTNRRRRQEAPRA